MASESPRCSTERFGPNEEVTRCSVVPAREGRCLGQLSKFCARHVLASGLIEQEADQLKIPEVSMEVGGVCYIFLLPESLSLSFVRDEQAPKFARREFPHISPKINPVTRGTPVGCALLFSAEP